MFTYQSEVGQDVHLSNQSGPRCSLIKLEWDKTLVELANCCLNDLLEGGVLRAGHLVIVNNQSFLMALLYKRVGRLTSKLATSITAFLVSTDTVIRSPEKIFGTDSSPNMSWEYPL